jgi:dihydrofolate reductase
MSRLTLQMQASRDGFVDGTAGVPWALWDWGPDWTWSQDLRDEFNNTFDRVSGILLSRPMMEGGYLDHWTSIAEQKANDPDFRFARRVVELPKLIVTGSKYAAADEGVEVVPTPLEAAVRKAGEIAGGDLICFGGVSFATALLAAGLVDDLQLYVNPGDAVDGLKIVDSISSPTGGVLLDETAYACGIVVRRWAMNRA